MSSHRAARAPEHWPAAVEPEPDELLSSWLHRLALAHGWPPAFLGRLSD